MFAVGTATFGGLSVVLSKEERSREGSVLCIENNESHRAVVQLQNWYL